MRAAEEILPSSWLQVIRDWAETAPDVAAVYLFGSYAKGVETATSDLDLAVIVKALHPDHEDDYTRWFFQNKHWSRTLSDGLPIPIDLQLGNPEISDAIVGPAIKAYGVLIFARPNWQGLD